MDDTYLHRLSRPYRPVAGVSPHAASGHGGEPVSAAEPPRSGARERRRRPVTACEICGRTLLTGERAREVALGERIVWACPLCVIGAQHTKPRAA